MNDSLHLLLDEQREHSRRVAKILENIALNYNIGIPAELAFLCGLYHDIGKIYIPHDLYKKQIYSQKDTAQLKSHVELGYNFILQTEELAHLGIKDREIMALCAGFHHEKANKSGYPKGDNIEKLPFIVALLSIVDFYDNSTHQKYYTDIAEEKIYICLIKAESGGTFSSKAASLFLDWYNTKKNLQQL